MIRTGLNIFDGIGSIADQLCEYLASLTTNKNYSVALPGGNTPKEVFQHIARKAPVNIRWENFHFFWGDERCVGPGHPDSNYRMAYENLLAPLGIQPQFVHRIIGEDDPAYEADRYTVEILKNVKSRDGFVTFDLIILGLGEDGHTASIFPGQDKVINSTRICDTAIHPVSGQKRITLTFETINHAENVFFLATGEKKSALINEIVCKSGNWMHYPAARVSPVSGGLSWILDREAASALKQK